jgi:predicted O-methyltransferase YrrM
MIPVRLDTSSAYTIHSSDLVQDRRVLELGSGAGFLGLLMAALQMDRLDHSNRSSRPTLVLSDVNSEVLLRCRENFLLPCSKILRVSAAVLYDLL